MAETCACFYLRKSAREVSHVYDAAFSPLSLRSTQFLVLLVIRLSREASMSELAESLGVDRTTLTRLVAPLRRRKLIRVVHGKDRRNRLLRLTPAGEKIVEEAVPYWEQAQAKVMGLVGNSDWSSLLTVLKKTSQLADGAGG